MHHHLGKIILSLINCCIYWLEQDLPKGFAGSGGGGGGGISMSFSSQQTSLLGHRPSYLESGIQMHLYLLQYKMIDPRTKIR